MTVFQLGGTIGDIEGMPFVEAFRQFQFRVKRENFCCVHVSLVPQVCAISKSCYKKSHGNSYQRNRVLECSKLRVLRTKQMMKFVK